MQVRRLLFTSSSIDTRYFFMAALSALTLLKRTTCPHCWKQFAPEDSLWISTHPDLRGDPRLGLDALRRFLPSRFTVAGQAIDSRGQACHDLACPHCHLPVPRAFLEIEPIFVSILGTPSCGKSFYLAAASWELRRLLPNRFKVALADVDPVSNRTLAEYEESLFLNADPQKLTPLADLIRKTELQGELYDSVSYEEHSVNYPRPFMFSIRPQVDHPNAAAVARLARVLCLYDNAGEHFLAGADSAASPVTQHMIRSAFLLFMFDPTQDQRFRQLLREKLPAAAALIAGRNNRQEILLAEAAARIRRYTGLSATAKHNRPLIVAVTKQDIWEDLAPDVNGGSPWVTAKDGLCALDLAVIEKRSQAVRSLLLRVTPEFVAATDSLSDRVTFIGVSALGRQPEKMPSNAGEAVSPERAELPAIRPGMIEPRHVALPFLHGLGQALSGLIPLYKRKTVSAVANASK
jgi:hypothetical protein